MHSYVDIEEGQGAVWLSQFPEVLIIANGGWTLNGVNDSELLVFESALQNGIWLYVGQIHVHL